MDNSLDSHDDISQDNGFHEEIEEKIYKYNGEEITKKYLKGKFLGKGGFAKCYEIKSKHNKKIFAAKIVNKENLQKPSAKSKLKSEIKIHKSLFHTNIVKFEHVFEDTENVYILLELCNKETLNEMLKKRKVITELEAKYYLDQIIKGVKFMHKNRVIHRDLKLGNLFLNEKMEIKIGDFGLATCLKYDGERRHTVCGTPNYIAPEILDNKNGHSYEVDYWAIGVITYSFLIGKPPFETLDVKETYKRIHDNIYSFPDHVFISKEAKDFIKKILVTNPNERLNLEKMRLHPFMSMHPIPKSLPDYVVEYPPNSQFYRKYRGETLKIEDINDFSYLSEFDDFNIYLKEIREFAAKNVVQIPIDDENGNANLSKDKLNKGKSLNKQKNINNYRSMDLNHQFNPDKKIFNLSQNKENHKLLQKNKIELNINDLEYIDKIVDYSNNFGFMYITTKNLIGIVFNNKSLIHKEYKNEEFHHIHKEQNKSKKHKLLKKTIESFSTKGLNDVPSEIRMKYEILSNYEKYLENTNAITNKKENSQNSNKNMIHIHVKKIIMTEKCYIIKLSNNIIQLIFSDNSKIIIDSEGTKTVCFIDKRNKIFTCNINSVNKSTNKKFVARYDYYKKIFNEKLEERFLRRQNKKEERGKIVIENINFESNFSINSELNKTN